MAVAVGYIGNIKSPPVWAGDFGGREHIMPFPAKVDASAFTDAGAIVVTVGANAAQNATSITIAALAYPFSPAQALIAGAGQIIPAGTVLYFGGAKVATLTADANLGDTTLTVAALPTALVTGDVARFVRYGTVFIPSGTLVGRTYTERDAGTAFGVADVATPDDEIFLTVFDVTDARTNNDIELYRPGSLVKENYLPNYAVNSQVANYLIQIRKIYRCIKGAD